jgi:hypothetical protein
VNSPVELWGHVAPHFRTLHLQIRAVRQVMVEAQLIILKDSVPTAKTCKKSYGVMRLTTDDEAV